MLRLLEIQFAKSFSLLSTHGELNFQAEESEN